MRIKNLGNSAARQQILSPQQPAAAGNKKQRRFVRAMAKFPPAPGNENRYCHVIPNSGKCF
jgi:hypothetical protein